MAQNPTEKKKIKDLLTTKAFKRNANEIDMSEKEHRNKRRNVRQKKRGIIKTGKISGRYQLGYIFKNDNFDKMKRELTMCRLSLIDESKGTPLTFPEMKNALKKHEFIWAGIKEEYNNSFFQSLSKEEFIQRKPRDRGG